jgi:hypothetical protein
MAPGKVVTLVTSRDRLIADKPGDIGQRAQEWLEKRGVQVGPVLILSCNQCMMFVAAPYPFRTATSSSGSSHDHCHGVREDTMPPTALAACLTAVTSAQLARLCCSTSCSACTSRPGTGSHCTAVSTSPRHTCCVISRLTAMQVLCNARAVKADNGTYSTAAGQPLAGDVTYLTVGGKPNTAFLRGCSIPLDDRNHIQVRSRSINTASRSAVHTAVHGNEVQMVKLLTIHGALQAYVRCCSRSTSTCGWWATGGHLPSATPRMCRRRSWATSPRRRC